MTVYKLPEWMGGLTCKLHTHWDESGTSTVDVDAPGGASTHRLTVPRLLLTEVKPPLPEEPPVGAIVLDRDGDAWARKDQGDKPWECGGLDADWEHLNNRYGPLVRMVPDPLASAPELPFALGSCERSAMVSVLDGNRVSLAIENEWYTPDEAERIGLAALRAAHEARAAS